MENVCDVLTRQAMWHAIVTPANSTVSLLASNTYGVARTSILWVDTICVTCLIPNSSAVANEDEADIFETIVSD